jgi:hypothetical protein
MHEALGSFCVENNAAPNLCSLSCCHVTDIAAISWVFQSSLVYPKLNVEEEGKGKELINRNSAV